MKCIRVLQGAQVEHWLDRYKREHRNINLPGNYIRIPAKAWIVFQEIRNKAGGKRKTLFEQNKEFEEGR